MNYLEDIYSIIESRSGLTINSAHKLSMKDFIFQRMSNLKMTDSEYYSYLKNSNQEFAMIIDEAAINETYFFREEQQFDFLKQVYFPQNKERPLTIWSAACSTGEEPLSLYALAKHCNADVKIYASDIDTHALQILKDKKYKKNSFRKDGEKYHSLFKLIGNYQDSELLVNQDTLDNIDSFYYNLVSTEPPKILNESVDIIFVRNVFIYFTPEVRLQILKKLSNILKPSGLMFLSVNEIVTIYNTEDLMLTKEHSGSVYYLRKISAAEENKPKQTFLKKEIAVNIEKKTENHSTDINEDIKELYKAIVKSLNEHDCIKAMYLLQSYYFTPNKMEFLYYFEGLIHIEEGNTILAEKSFEKAMILNKDFWPAIFQFGISQKKNGKNNESKKTFALCSESINSYLKNNDLCYNFFTGSFSPEYFLVLCNNFINGV